MPGISVSKTCIPFGGGQSWSSYWETLISATVETAAPTHVVLTFPSAKASLGASDFTIAGFTISSASWTGAVLTLVLSEAVLVFDGNLTITFVTTGQTATVTNNVADDGNTVFWGDAAEDSCLTDVNNLVEVWFDKTHKGALGDIIDTGASVPGSVYQIVTTEPDHFRVGLEAGDVYFADIAVTIDANNTLRKFAGNSLGQITAARKPLKNTSNIYFQGVDQSLYSSQFGFTQPEYVYMVIKQKSWVSGMGIFDGVPGALTGTLYQTGTTPELRIRAGTGVAGNTGLAVGDWGIVRIEINGASSKLQVDDNDATTGNPGANNMNGIRIGGIGTDCAEFELMEAIFRSSNANWDAIYNCLLRKYDFFFRDVIKIGWMTDNHIISTAVENPYTPYIVGGIRYHHTAKMATRQAIDKFNEEEVDLIINTGDILDDADGIPHFMEEWNRGIAQKELTIGGHDVSFTRAALVEGFGYSEYDVNAGSAFNQTFLVDKGRGLKIRIIMVDTARPEEYYTDGGVCDEETRNWIASILAADTENNVMIFLHEAPHMYDRENIFVDEDAIALNEVIATDLTANPDRKITCHAGHDHGYGTMLIYSRPGWANWPCYVLRKGIVDCDPTLPNNGGFAILSVKASGTITYELYDKIYPYTS